MARACRDRILTSPKLVEDFDHRRGATQERRAVGCQNGEAPGSLTPGHFVMLRTTAHAYGCPAVWSATGSGQLQEVANRRPQPRRLALTGDHDRHHAWIVRRRRPRRRAIALGRWLR